MRRSEGLQNRWIRTSWLMVAIAIAIPLTPAESQSSVPDAGLHPLRLADTSSPRDTLRSFMENADRYVALWHEEADVKSMAVFVRAAASTFDPRSSAHSGSWLDQSLSVMQLYEILARIELPSIEAIPGPEEVGTEGIERWTLPNTRITIERQTSGPRFGEFLFTATTVDRLEIDYRRVRHLPYRPGKIGIVEEVIVANRALAQQAAAVLGRIEGIDLSSPRATLESFLESVNAAFQSASAAEAALRSSPPEITRERAREIDLRATNSLRSAAIALDLSQVPEVQREDVARQSVLQLKEIFDRLLLPPIELVPDLSMVEASRIRGVPYQWKIPDTEIRIVELQEGERAGDFVFSAQTVAQLATTYELLRDLPYRSEIASGVNAEYRSAALSPGFFESYRTTPGMLVPSSTWLGRLALDLPVQLQKVSSGQTRWQWIGLVLSAIGAVVLAVTLYRLVTRIGERAGSLANYWFGILAPLTSAFVVRLVTTFADEELNITGNVLYLVQTTSDLVVLTMLTWVIWRSAIALSETAIAARPIKERGIDANFLRIVARIFAVMIATVVVITRLRQLGADAAPLLAGLGVGGLAAALALRPTLENLIGGLVLYIDRPVQVGDDCAFGGSRGTVESIGLRSTQIRGHDRTLTSVPNSKFVDMELVNWSRCERLRLQTVLNIRSETTPDQLRVLLTNIREVLHAHPKIDESTVRVNFSGYGADSQHTRLRGFALTLRCFVLTQDWNEFFAVREDVYLQINDLTEQAGIDFA